MERGKYWIEPLPSNGLVNIFQKMERIMGKDGEREGKY